MSQLVMGPVGRPAFVSAPVAVSVSASASASVRSVRARLARVRWDRLLALFLAVALSGVALVAVLGRASAESPVDRGDGAVVTGSRSALQEHVVAPGDTIWQLAVSVAPADDPRETVDRIMRLNGLDDVDVQVGRVLLIPNR